MIILIKERKQLTSYLHILLDLVMNYDHVIKVFDLGTLNHDRLSDVHILGVSAPDDKASLKPAD